MLDEKQEKVKKSFSGDQLARLAKEALGQASRTCLQSLHPLPLYQHNDSFRKMLFQSETTFYIQRLLGAIYDNVYIIFLLIYGLQFY